MGRSNWYYDHPPACNCAKCTAERTQTRSASPLSALRSAIAPKPSDKDSLLKRLRRKLSGG